MFLVVFGIQTYKHVFVLMQACHLIVTIKARHNNLEIFKQSFLTTKFLTDFLNDDHYDRALS